MTARLFVVALLLGGSGLCSVALDRRREALAAAVAGQSATAARLSRFPAPAAAASRSLERLGLVALGSARAFLLDLLWCQAVDQWMRKDWRISAATFQAIELLEPRVPEAYIANAWTACYQIAGEALARGDDHTAWSWLQRGLARLEHGMRNNPRSARLPYYLSFIYFDKGKREPYWSRFQKMGIHPVRHARALAAHAAELAPDNPSLWFWLARLSLLLDDAPGAVRALDWALRLLPPERTGEPEALAYFRYRLAETRRGIKPEGRR